MLVQVEGDVEDPPTHVHPVTGPVQSDLHLSRFDMFPSSQVSPVTFLLSPHTGVHTFGWTSKLQVNPSSIVQVSEQPSLVNVLKSSHPSEAVR